MKLTIKSIRAEANQQATILNSAVGNAKTSYCLRENVKRLSDEIVKWTKAVEGDILASKWLEHIRRGGDIEVKMQDLNDSKLKFKEFEDMEIEFDPYKISVDSLPDMMKVPVFKEDSEKKRVIDRWEDDPAATDALVRSLRAIGALEA